MPIRAYCTICSDFFEHSRDVAAIHCGHTFHYECLQQWFQTAPNKTCPQCRKQVSTRHIINKLFFDIGREEEGGAVDPENLQNELDRISSVLSTKERDCRDKQQLIESLKQMVEKLKLDLERLKKEIGDREMICTVLTKKLRNLEKHHSDTQAAKEEARQLRVRLKTYESLDKVLQGQRSEVEAMISDMGVGQSAVEQLSIYCVSLKKEYDNLKSSFRSTNEMSEKLRKEVFMSNNKLQKATMEVTRTKEDMLTAQKDLTNADKEIMSLKKKVEILQKTLSTPTRTNEAISRLVFESPAPLELKPRLNRPDKDQDIDLNLTFDVPTPEQAVRKPSHSHSPAKKMRLDPTGSSPSHSKNASETKKSHVKDDPTDPFLRNSILFRRKAFGSMLDPHSKPGVVRMGYDGLGGRTKFIQPSALSELRPLLMKAKRKKVSRPPMGKLPGSMTLDGFLE
ncbi:E3 ubiquitin-protein ligase TRAIP [Clupea harengus]|uniref:E3 ubiquitin-protein ligase TRAIP n=1 Tax=Clupea harengus TaxID=7950 RepID=A0A6P8FED9_CLUHA|nr:E3 ubiquitin-protein ligase TRAIP [Clupea harengus]XP_031423950.1 E3 ubiquitin-protein ligase TRAIP [Clupea harengus]